MGKIKRRKKEKEYEKYDELADRVGVLELTVIQLKNKTEELVVRPPAQVAETDPEVTSERRQSHEEMAIEIDELLDRKRLLNEGVEE